MIKEKSSVFECYYDKLHHNKRIRVYLTVDYEANTYSIAPANGSDGFIFKHNYPLRIEENNIVLDLIKEALNHAKGELDDVKIKPMGLKEYKD